MRNPVPIGARVGGRLSLAFLSAIALLLAGVGMSVYNDNAYRVQKARAVGVQADILAGAVSAALAFDDKASAQDYVNALKANPDVEAVGVYDAGGGLVAGFARQGRLPQADDAAGGRFGDARMTLSAPVAQGGAQLGMVRIRSILDPPARRLSRYAGLMMLVVMAALVMTVLGLAQAALKRANRELARRAEDLAEANRLLQVEIVERERAEAALRQSQKMEAIGRITGGVAHDFNNLLMVASSGLDLMERTKDPERRQVLRDGIRQALDRGSGLTRQLLAFSRRTPLTSEVVDLRSHIDGMRVLLDRSLREDVRVERKVDPDLWPVEIDPNQLELALLNIAVNARDAMPGGGVISITAENMSGVDDGELRGDFVRLSVTDRGHGMSPEILSHVFEPFFTTKEVGKGTGLGLSQVYGFAQSSRGRVRIDSAEGVGTTVSLWIPRSAKALAKPQPPPPRLEDQRGEGGRVLLVEDDDAVASMVMGMLEELGYRPTRASTAAAALDTLGRIPDFDLVFSDCVMPGAMNGIELAREIGRMRPELPVLLTSGFSEAAMSAAADGLRLLPKPYSIDALAAALEGAKADRAHH